MYSLCLLVEYTESHHNLLAGTDDTPGKMTITVNIADQYFLTPQVHLYQSFYVQTRNI
jgi:hypothetical protein